MRISRHYKQSSTHIPTLLRIIPKTKGDVCELGAGFFSTPILHWLCKGRKLVTYENDKDYFKFAKNFQSKDHRVREEIDFHKHWGVVFVDHTTNSKERQRGDDILKFTDADIFIIHDSEPEEEEHYHYNRLPKFKYRLDWKESKPYTSVLSNKINICE